MLQATPYTPVFPPSRSVPSSPTSGTTSCDPTTHDKSRVASKKPYIDRLKERYISLASMPQDELCPPSREASPEAESRIEALRLRMRKARELRFPHDPELTLACCGVRGGDWVGESKSDEEHAESQYVLPDTEEGWFQWVKKKDAARERRLAERKVAEHRQNIAKWSEEIENAPLTPLEGVSPPLHEEVQQADGVGTLGFPVVKNGTVGPKDKITNTHRPSLLCYPDRDDSEPVEKRSLPLPPAPALDPLPDFSDSFSIPNSPPSLPQLPSDVPFPYEIPPSPSFALNDIQISTPPKRDTLPNPVLQLSSPISPPRSLRPLTASRTLSLLPTKRPRESDDCGSDIPDVKEEPSTPRTSKKARVLLEPITPASVPRPNCSQEQTRPPNLKRLPTLTALLASARKSPRGRSRFTQTPRRDARVTPAISPSQPTYSMFRPQFQSTQVYRARSLPPSPSQPLTSTQPISPPKSSGPQRSSSGMGFYQSQFNVEDKVDKVAAFLDADVWDLGA